MAKQVGQGQNWKRMSLKHDIIYTNSSFDNSPFKSTGSYFIEYELARPVMKVFPKISMIIYDYLPLGLTINSNSVDFGI